MSNEIKYIDKDSILIRKFYGDVTINELKASLIYMINNDIISENKKGIISDFSEANFLVDQEDLLQLKDLFLKHYNLLGKLRFAQIITTPQIAKTILFQINNSDVKTKSFSTIRAAEIWIKRE